MSSNQASVQSKVINGVLFTLCLVILFYLEVIPYIGDKSVIPPSVPTDGMSMPEKMAYFGMLFSKLPPWVNVWMHFQDIIMGASLFFLFWHKAVRLYVLGIILNHVVLFALMPAVPGSLVSLDIAALSHFFWIPGLIVLIKEWTKIDKSSAYGFWVSAAIFQLCFSLSFDIPAGLSFIFTLF